MFGSTKRMQARIEELEAGVALWRKRYREFCKVRAEADAAPAEASDRVVKARKEAGHHDVKASVRIPYGQFLAFLRQFCANMGEDAALDIDDEADGELQPRNFYQPYSLFATSVKGVEVEQVEPSPGLSQRGPDFVKVPVVWTANLPDAAYT